jgi:hypothetical protein
MFIVFNTVNQANNYIKRHPGYYRNEGCGCCWSTEGHYISGNRVVSFYASSNVGHVSASATIVGRVKKR